jgi:hypothetical protein
MNAARRRAEAEAGFTIIELLIVVVLIGMIGVVIASVLTLALRLGPPTEGRVKLASETTFFINRIADDVANAKTIVDQNETPDVKTCKLGPSPHNGNASLGRFELNNGQTVEYFSRLFDDSGVHDVYRVVVYRKIVGGATKEMLHGYCPKNGGAFENQPTSATNDPAKPNYFVRIGIMATPTSELKYIQFSADRRDL